MAKRLICLGLVVLFSVVGLYSSVYLAKMHYKKPHHQLMLIDTLPFMERWFPRDQVESAVKSLDVLSDMNTVNPFDNPDFDPYAAAMDAPEDDKFVPTESCDISESFSCTKVDDSKYSKIAGVAVSAYGIVGYLAMIGLVLFHMIRRISRPDVFVFMLWVGSWLGMMFSIYLTIVEAVLIKSFCPYCIVSAVAMLGVFICMMANYGFQPLQMFVNGEIFPTSLFLKKNKK